MPALTRTLRTGKPGGALFRLCCGVPHRVSERPSQTSIRNRSLAPNQSRAHEDGTLPGPTESCQPVDSSTDPKPAVAHTESMPEAPDWLDELTQKPGPPWHAMGLRTLNRADWLLPDGRFHEELALKEQLSAQHLPSVFLAQPGTERPGREVLAMIERWLADHRPDLRSKRPDPDLHPLDAAARLVQEDLCLVAGAGHPLVAAAVAFPSHWRIADKIGLPIAAVHAPVHHYDDELRARVDTFLGRLAPGRLTIRRNLSFHDHQDLFRPEPPETFDTFTGGIEDLWLRSERQTLVRLTDHDAVLFTIKTQLAPLAVLADLPAVAGTLAARLRPLHAELDRIGHPLGAPRWLPDVLGGWQAKGE